MRKINSSQVAVLKYLASDECADWVMRYANIINATGLTRLKIVRAVRRLVREGDVEHTYAVYDDMMLKGSGFIITLQGKMTLGLQFAHYGKGTFEDRMNMQSKETCDED